MEVPRKCFSPEKHSYADVVKASKLKVGESDSDHAKSSISVSWNISEEEDDWFSRSAVRVLKEFLSIESVNQKLGFPFTSAYMKGKSIDWTFESNCDRDGFIRNSFFWKDVFLSMSKCGGVVAPRKSLKWIDVFGVLLCCWGRDFFKKIVGKIGDMLWVEENTELKERLDNGRLLVLVPPQTRINCEIMVKVEGRSFPVRLTEHTTPVLIAWVDKFLGLKPMYINLNSELNLERFDATYSKGDNECSSYSKCQTDNDWWNEKVRLMEIEVNKKEGKRRHVRVQHPRIYGKERNVIGENSVLDKGNEA
ncbi:hypothetical protein Q3G72_000670 [Acer saccharum]|nr:hypothetical protein Q3G72_000670 [Acer saccharum]